jgi:pimeloyl-[acyl-carrier protein] methyl ester esterase
LYTESHGTGANLVMLHGWGMHSGVWSDFAQQLAQYYRVTLIDLPGHGRSSALPVHYDLDSVTAMVAESAPKQAHWLGWSLGGVIAQYMALERPERVDRLVLVAGTPQFVSASDWPDATDPTVLDQFGQSLLRDHRATLQRFLALEVQTSASARDELRMLRDRVFARGEPAPVALEGGLRILRETNLRPRLCELKQPTLLVLGERDVLVPAATGFAVQQLLPGALVKSIVGAGHAPFLIRGAECTAAVREFLQ